MFRKTNNPIWGGNHFIKKKNSRNMACSKFLTDEKLEEIIAHLSESGDGLEADVSESDLDIQLVRTVLGENIN